MLAATLFLGAASGSRAQVMEPLSYTNAPIGLNFLIAGYGYLWGDVLTDPSLPIKDADSKVHTAVLAYARVLDFWGQSGGRAGRALCLALGERRGGGPVEER